jgi:peptide/nickel transport system substrate-binding protein
VFHNFSSAFVQDALRGKISRRNIIALGLRAGLSTSLISALLANAPETSASTSSNGPGRFQRLQEGGGTFTAIIEDGSPDIDPHSTYVTIGSVFCLACYEMLIQYKGESTSEFAPMLAESWEVSPDNATYTFKIPANATFHDGTICDATAVKSSFVRFRRLELGPYLVIARFCDNPEEQIEVVDATTVRFNLGTPQPLFLAAMASC